MDIDRAALARDMAALAADRAQVVHFVEAYGDRLAGTVRSILRELGRGDLAGRDDEVSGLVWDAALAIWEHAGSWEAGGAMPWTWARKAIRSEVAAFIGHARADVDPDELAERAEDAPAHTEDIDVEELAHANPLLGLWWEAVARTGASDRNRRIHAEYRIQHSCGDPSPAHTVERHLGVRADNVRQIDRRLRVALARVVAADERYSALRDIPWLALPPDPTTPPGTTPEAPSGPAAPATSRAPSVTPGTDALQCMAMAAA
jgi:hypothetical protein